LRGGGSALTFTGIFILRFSRNSISRGDNFRRIQHTHPQCGFAGHQPGFFIPCGIQIVLDKADGFDAAGDCGRNIVDDHTLSRLRNCLQTRGAIAVHRHSAGGLRQSCTDRREARDIVASGALGQAAAQGDVFNFTGIDTSAGNGMFYGMAGEYRAVGIVEGAPESSTGWCAGS
jgi:hypothetical protein